MKILEDLKDEKLVETPGHVDIQQFFVSHLDRIYCAKLYFIDQLPEIIDISNSPDLKDSIETTMVEVRNQIERMREIYEILGESYTMQYCKSLRGLIEELYSSIKSQGSNKELQDLAIIYYIQNIESVEMASFQMLQIAAMKLKNDKVTELMSENFAEAKAQRALLLILSAKYFTN